MTMALEEYPSTGFGSCLEASWRGLRFKSPQCGVGGKSKGATSRGRIRHKAEKKIDWESQTPTRAYRLGGLLPPADCWASVGSRHG